MKLKQIKKKINNLIKKDKKNYIVIVIFIALVAAFYGNTLFNGFVFDDNSVIEGNVYLQEIQYAPKVITGCVWEYGRGTCNKTTLYYRPMQSLSYLLTYQISWEPWAFHLANLFYFFIVVYLIFILTKTLTKNFKISFLAALIFLIHPINNEVVNWISAVSELTFGIFALLTTIYYIKYRQTKQTKNLTSVYIFYFFALLSKETAVVLPLVFIFADLLIFEIKIKKLFDWSKGELKKYLLFILPLVTYFIMRVSVIGFFVGLGQGEIYYVKFNFSERIYAFFVLFLEYLEKLFFPFPLLLFHSFKVKESLLDVKFLISLVIFFAFFTVAYILAKKKRGIVSFFLLWIFILLLPVLIFFDSVGENIFSERYVFVSAIGFSIIIAYVLDYLQGKIKKSKTIITIAVIVIIAISWLTVYPRNRIWKDNISLFQNTLALNPNAHPIREHLSTQLLISGDDEAAKIELEKIIKQKPDWKYISKIYNRLGNYYRKNENFEKAEEYYLKATETASKINNYKPYNNLGALYFENERYLVSLPYFCKAMQMSPEAEEAKNNFSKISSMIEGVPEESFIFLYQDFMQGEAFTASGDDEKILYHSKLCIGNSCFYIFNPQMENEVMLPFLIMSKSFPSEIIKIKNYYLSPDSRTIILRINKEHEDKSIDFIFPSCEGVYYTVTVVPDEK